MTIMDVSIHAHLRMSRLVTITCTPLDVHRQAVTCVMPPLCPERMYAAVPVATSYTAAEEE